MRGLRNPAGVSHRPVWSRLSCSTAFLSAMPPMSAPAANPLGPPVSTTARTVSSASRSARAAVSSRIRSGLSAFRTFGRVSVTVAIGSSISTRTFSYPIAPYHRLNGQPQTRGLLRQGGRRPTDLRDLPLQLPRHLLHGGESDQLARRRGQHEL